jgi:MFS family permease
MANAPAPSRQPSYRRVLRHRAFLLVWAGGGVSSLGDHFFDLALMWFTFTATRSSLEVAAIAVAYQVTYVVVGPVAGVLGDRWDQRRAMMVCDLIRTALVGGFAILTWRVGYSFPIALGTIIVEESVGRFFGPSRSAYIPTLVERDELVTANGLMSGTRQAAGLGGQAAAGFVIAAVGALAGFVIDAASFGLSALALGFVRIRTALSVEVEESAESSDPAAEGRSPFWAEMRAGWAILARTPVILTLAPFGTLLNAFFARINPAMPAYVLDQLHTGAWVYGLVGLFQFGGGLVGGFLAGAVVQRLRAGPLIIALGVTAGAAVLAVGLLHILSVALCIWGFWGFTLSVMSVVEQSLEQVLIPQEYLARVLAFISSVGMALMPVGSLVGGYLANRLGPGPLYVLIGCGFMAIAVVMVFNTAIRTATIGDDRGYRPGG